MVGDDLLVTNTAAPGTRHRRARRQQHPGQAQPDRHPDRDDRGGRDGAPRGLDGGDQPSLRRDGGHDHRRPGGRTEHRPDQDRRISRGERIAKYNRLLRIEEELATPRGYAGRRAFAQHRSSPMPDVLDVGEQLAALWRRGSTTSPRSSAPRIGLAEHHGGALAGRLGRRPDSAHRGRGLPRPRRTGGARRGEGRRTDVGPGTVAYVAAGVEHRFVDIAEDLQVVVFWSRRGTQRGR